MPNILGYCLLLLTIKGEVSQYYKGLITSIKNNHVLIEQFFHNVPLRGEDLKRHTSQLEILLIRKDIWRSFSSTSLERSLSDTANQPLCCQTPGRRLLDSYNTLKENTKLWPDLHVFWWLRSEDFLELRQRESDKTACPRCPDQVSWNFVAKPLMMT